MSSIEEQNQRIISAHEEANLAFEGQLNDQQTRNEIITFLRYRLPFVRHIKCDEENNPPEIVDKGLCIVHLDSKPIIIGKKPEKKLQEFLEDLFNGHAFDGVRNTLGYILDTKALNAIKSMLGNLDEFKDANISIYNDSENIPLSEFKTYMLFDGVKLSGDVKLLSIHAGGPMSTIDLLETPRYSIVRYYDPNEFIPTQKLILSCPILTEEIPQDLINQLIPELKQQLYDTINKMVDYPNDFLIPDKLPIMIRAIIDHDTCDLGRGQKMTVTINRKNA